MIPNILTLLRIFSIPVVVALFYHDDKFSRAIITIVFMFACFTDFLDGYLARQWKQVSKFGRFLDPIADKLLISTILLMLAGFGNIQGFSLIPAAIILCREILVSGLREFLALTNLPVPVTQLAKWKTATQMFSLTCLLASMAIETSWLKDVGILTLWISALLTIITGYGYMSAGLASIATSEDEKTK